MSIGRRHLGIIDELRVWKTSPGGDDRTCRSRDGKMHLCLCVVFIPVEQVEKSWGKRSWKLYT